MCGRESEAFSLTHIFAICYNRKYMMHSKKLNLVETMSIAIGTMIGASIFSIFGLGVSLAGKLLPLAFIISGIYALAVAYSYTILGKKIISNAGPMAFILEAFGDTLTTGVLSVLMWLSYVISIALFAKGFAGYAVPFFHLPNTSFVFSLFEVGIILFFTALNFFGSKAVGKAEFWIVLLKLLILSVFIIGGLTTLHLDLLKSHINIAHFGGVLNASVIFFLSYMGFGLVTNVSENVKNPEKNIPRAMYYSIFFVMVFYLLISMVSIGNLPLQDIMHAQENALAIVAQPFLGTFGFVLVSLGAIFSTSSALNATIFGGANISYALAKDGELPEFFERKVWFKAIEGLYITVGIGIAFVLFFDLNAIASIVTTVFTVVYLFVLLSHLRLYKTYGGEKWLIQMNIIILLFVFFFLMRYQWMHSRAAFYTSILAFVFAFILERIYRGYRFIHH